jgi:colanic acid/amylovoran biosynthesis glycosyltransferase
MRIAFIVYLFPKISETFILNQIVGLMEQGHEVKIFARYEHKEKNIPSDVEEYDLMNSVQYIPNFTAPRHIQYPFIIIIYQIKTLCNKIFRYLKGNYIKDKNLIVAFVDKIYLWLNPFINNKFDIIYCQFGQNGDLGVAIKRIGIGKKLVIMFHGSDIRMGIEKGGLIYRNIFKYTDCLLSISDYNYSNLIQFGAPPNKILYHPVGIDLKKFPFRSVSLDERNSDPIIILTVARLVEEKGIKYGIQAIANVKNKIPETDIEYRIVGGGPLENELKELVNDLNMNKHIRFLGPMDQNEVAQQMLSSHIFLLPSIAEALPTVLMEAQATGLPVIAAAVGSVSELVIDMESGFLFPARYIDMMVEKIVFLINHPELWKSMGIVGRRHIKENYDINILNKKLCILFQNILNRN